MKAIKLLVVFIIFLSVKDAIGQLPCAPPIPVSPTYYVSVDPPTFIWEPLQPYPPPCFGLMYWVGVAQASCYGCPGSCGWPPIYTYIENYFDLRASNWTLSNYQWNLVPPDTMLRWGTHTLSGAALMSCGGYVKRLNAALPPPSLIYPNNGDTGVSLTTKLDWTKVDSATSYRVRIYNTPMLNISILDTLVTRDSMFVSVGTLLGSTAYWWRVKAYKTGGEGPFADAISFTTLFPQIPPTPNLVSPPNNSIGQNLSLTLVWNKSSTATTYRVQVATDSLFSGLIVNDSTLTDSTKAILGLNPLTYYWWRVSAKNLGGTSSYSAVWKFKTLGSPFQVILLSPVNNAVNQPTSIVFTWNKAAEQTSPFEIVKMSHNHGDGFDAVSNYWFDMVTDTVTQANLVRDTTLTDTAKSLSGLNNLTSYYWRVKARNQIGWGNYSVWFKFTTIVNVPPAPVLLSPPNNSTGQPISLNLVWHPSLMAATYRVQLSADSLFGSVIVNDSTVTDTIRAVSGLSYLTRYYWRVNAKNIAGISSFSAIWNFTTGPQPPALVNLKVIPGGFYVTGVDQLNMKDTIRVILVDSATCTWIDSTEVLLDSISLSTNLNYSVAPTGKYYIYVFHRNHLAISSRYTQNVIRGSNVSYDFTTDSAKTYGFNVVKVSSSPVRWGMIPADANQDGYVDGLDQTVWVVQNGANGYFEADFNGDTYVDGLDQTLWVIYNGNSTALPCYFTVLIQLGQPGLIIKKEGPIINKGFKKDQNNVKKE